MIQWKMSQEEPTKRPTTWRAVDVLKWALTYNRSFARVDFQTGERETRYTILLDQNYTTFWDIAVNLHTFSYVFSELDCHYTCEVTLKDMVKKSTETKL